MGTCTRFARTASLVLTAATVWAAVAPPTAAQDGETNREIHGIAQEQDQLLRQMRRLRGTMEVLLQRLEAEGRTRTAELLRDAITMLDQRTTPETEENPLTIEERMERARETLRSGQLVQSLENQRGLVDELERLLSILLDRKNLEALDDKIEELRALQESIKALANRESELREKTAELRNDAANATQKALEKELGELISRERELLAENETIGRETGTLELEQLEAELARLLRDQNTDAAVLDAWNPQEARMLEGVRQDLARAQRDEARAARLDSAADELQRARRASTPESTERSLEALEAAAERAELHRDASGDAAAKQTAEALRRAAEALKRALAEAQAGNENEDGEQGDASPANSAVPEALGEAMRSDAEALAAEAEAARAAAAKARAAAKAALDELPDPNTAAGEAAASVNEALEDAELSAAEGNDADAKRATDDAASRLEAALRDLAMLGAALSSSQEKQAERTERVERGLATMPQAETEAGAEAQASLDRAAEAMRASAEAARTNQAEAAQAEARKAEQALAEAQASLGAARSQAAEAQAKGAEALAQAQAELAQAAGQASEKVESGSMSEAAQAETKTALEKAQQAMERAQKELEEGRSASAASSQREAMQELREALSSANEGVAPESAEDRAQAEELAREQEEIREELLDLARRIRERENASPMPDLERANDAAEEAKESLEQGQLSQAEQKEREVEQELKQIKSKLEEEEDQYQKLRDEEKLFRIAEETQALIEAHREQMQELIELDALRQAGSPPSRAQKLRLRRISREEESLGHRALEMSTAIVEEGALVAGQLFANAADDLDRIATALSDAGDYETGARTQALQRDVDEAFVWMLDALQEEQARRQEEDKKKEEQGEQPPQEGENKDSLIPDTAELKLLRRMEISLQDDVLLILQLNPDLADTPPEDVDRHILRDISRLALRHERITENFSAMRRRIGIPEPEEIED